LLHDEKAFRCNVVAGFAGWANQSFQKDGTHKLFAGASRGLTETISFLLDKAAREGKSAS
jgi:hypothetical protein